MNIKKIIKYAFAASAVLWTAACMRDAEPSPARLGPATDGKVAVSLPIDMTDFTKPVVTRADAIPNPNETSLETVLIYVFEGDDRNSAMFAEMTFAEIEGNTLKFLATPRQGPVWIAVVANQWSLEEHQDAIEHMAGGDEKEYLAILNEIWAGQDLETICLNTFDVIPSFYYDGMDESLNILNGAYLNYKDNEDGPSSCPILMTSLFKSEDGVHAGMQPPGGTLKLKRVTAKVTVESQDADFVPVSMMLYNTPLMGTIFRFTDHIPDAAGQPVTQAYDPGLINPGIAMALYPFEAPKTNPPLLFLTALYKGTKYTYILPFNDADGDPVDIIRNRHYKFVIDEGSEGIYGFDIESGNLAGYLAMISQVDFRIDVTDMNGHSIISNGDYFLGVSNDELLVMGETGIQLKNIHAVTVTTNFSYEWNVSDRHLFENETMIVDNDTYCLKLPQPGEVESTDIMISLPAYVNTGKLTIRVGDLEKTVTVKRVPPYSYSEKGYLLGTDILHAEVDEQGSNDWLRGFSTAEESGSAEPVLTRSAKGPVYMQTKNWKGLRDASFYYTREGGGRTKVVASVIKPDFDTSLPNCYIIEPGEIVDIPVEKAFGIWADPQIMTSEYELFCDGETAEVLWQDNPTVGFVVPELIRSGEPNEYVIRVTAHPTEEGNAVVYFSSEGEIRWSWHIWVTADKDIVNAGAGTDNQWMDRNIGALINSWDENRQGDVTGLIYQYGRKDPFPSSENATSSVVKTIYNSQSNPVNVSVTNGRACILKEAITTPTNYYETSVTIGDWTTELKNRTYLWRDPYTSKTGTPRAKSVFDPCPDGWMVPRYGDFKKTTPEWEFVEKGRFSSEHGGYYPTFIQVKVPTNSEVYTLNVGGNAYYRTATTTYSANGAYSLLMHDKPDYSGSTYGDFYLDHGTYNYIGTLVRCIRHIP